MTCLLLWATLSGVVSLQSISPLSSLPTGTEYVYSYRSSAQLYGNLNVTLDATVSIPINEPVYISGAMRLVRASRAHAMSHIPCSSGEKELYQCV